MKTVTPETCADAEHYVELAEGGPWLGQDLKVVMDFKDRGVWPSFAEAQQALEMAFNQPDDPRESNKP